ncbi:MAG: cysteine desulfurase [Actinomycetota bacterium]|nr:cysteine desulfurase [Actinomycetota bacterium]MDQ3529184.1 cysteine desulfurase [Actinomycetota bacterium]
MAYLDHASATPWHPAALAAYQQVAGSLIADPTRRHAAGRRARDLLESARGAIAGMFGAPAERIVMTSGGTEAIHLAVLGGVAANRTRPRRIVSSAVEHSAVLAAAEASGYACARVAVDPLGRVDLEGVRDELGNGAALVNLMHANHEVGTVQPVAEVAALCREYDALLHVDACQTAGRVPVDLGGLGADYLSVSAAKFGGGRGTGALLLSPRARLRPLLAGDERERRRRAGLEHLPGIAAMAEALLQLAPNDPYGPAAEAAANADALRRHLRERLPAAVDDVAVHGPDDGAAPHIVAVSALYCDGEALVSALDAAGYAVHSGSSCATTSGEPSHVLVAMGALTHGHVRVSLGAETTPEDVDGFVGAFATAVAKLRGDSLGAA